MYLQDPWKELRKTSLIKVSSRLYAKLETENPLQTYSKFDHDLVTKVIDRMFEEEE